MKGWKLLIVLALVAFECESAVGQTRFQPSWQSRWLLEVSGNVLSPGGVDKDRFTTSLGVGMSVIYWVDWDTQLLVSGRHSSLKTDPYYWLPEEVKDDSITLSSVDVNGNVWILSLEARKLFPSDRQNFLYLGLGLDYFNFGKVEASWLQSSGTNNVPIPKTTTTRRDPSWAAGVHASPGLFFLLYPKVSVDLTIRLNTLYDSQNWMIWLEPSFGMGFQID